MLLTAATITIVALAAVLHRISGMGFALIAMPMLIVLQGPVAGLQLGLVLGLLVCVIALVTCWRAVQARPSLLLSIPAVVTVPLGAWLAGLISPPAQLLSLGILLGLLLLISLRVRPAEQGRSSTSLTLTAGSVAGVVHVMSGLSAPVLAAYAIRTRWSQSAFVASAQVVFIVLNTGSLIARRTPWSELRTGIMLVPALAIGVLVGARFARKISADSARRLSVVIALAAAALSIIKGVAGL